MSIRLRDLSTHAWISLQGQRAGVPNHRQCLEAQGRRAARQRESTEASPAVHVVDAPGATDWEIAGSIAACAVLIYGLARLMGP